MPFSKGSKRIQLNHLVTARKKSLSLRNCFLSWIGEPADQSIVSQPDFQENESEFAITREVSVQTDLKTVSRGVQTDCMIMNGKLALSDSEMSRKLRGIKNKFVEEDDEYFMDSEDREYKPNQKGQSFVPPDEKQVYIGTIGGLMALINALARICFCFKDGLTSSWFIDKISTYRQGGGILLSVICNGCANRLIAAMDTSGKVKCQLLLSSLAAGFGYGKYLRQMNALGLKGVCKNTFQKFVKKVEEKAKSQLDNSIEKNLNRLKEIESEKLGSFDRMVVELDTAWQIRRNGACSTTTFKAMLPSEIENERPEAVILISRNHNSHTKMLDGEACPASSQAMEGIGTMKGCEFLKSKGAAISIAIQDGDSSSKKKLKEYFPNVESYQCSQHIARKLRKDLMELMKVRKLNSNEREKLAKDNPVFSERILSTPDCKCQKRHSKGCGCINEEFIHFHGMASFYRCIKNYGTNVKEFKKHLKNYALFHVIGNHLQCEFHDFSCVCGLCSEKDICPSRANAGDSQLDCQFHHLLFVITISNCADKADTFLVPELGGALTTNHIESTNSKLTEYRNKSHPLHGHSYQARTDMALLDNNMTDHFRLEKNENIEHWLKLLSTDLNLPISTQMEAVLKNDINMRHKSIQYSQNYRDTGMKKKAKVEKLKRASARKKNKLSKGNAYGLKKKSFLGLNDEAENKNTNLSGIVPVDPPEVKKEIKSLETRKRKRVSSPKSKVKQRFQEFVSDDELKLKVKKYVETSLETSQNRRSPSPEILCIQQRVFYFLPVHLEWCLKMSRMFGIPYRTIAPYNGQNLKQRLYNREPLETLDVAPDGNCLFRSLSWVISGSEKFHKQVRKNICDYMLQHADDDISKEYIIKMRKNKKWGTHLEITAFTKLSNCNIYVYSEYQNGNWQWLEYGEVDSERPSLLLMNRPKNIHFKIVLVP